MGRGYSAGGNTSRGDGASGSIPQLTGRETYEEIAAFAKENTAYELADSMKKCDVEVLIANVNMMAALQAEYGSPARKDNHSLMEYNGRLKRTAGQFDPRTSGIEVGNSFNDASKMIRDANANAYPEYILDGLPAGHWALPMNASRSSSLSYVLSHELGHAYMQRQVKDLYGSTAEATYDKAWREIIETARSKYGYEGTAEVTSAYAASYVKGSPHRSREAFAEAFAGYTAGKRDAISRAANDWLKR